MNVGFLPAQHVSVVDGAQHVIEDVHGRYEAGASMRERTSTTISEMWWSCIACPWLVDGCCECASIVLEREMSRMFGRC